MLLGIVPHGTVAGTGFTPDRHQRDYAYYGAIADGIWGLKFIVTGIKGIFPGLLN